MATRGGGVAEVTQSCGGERPQYTCGDTQPLHLPLTYESQLAFKQQQVKNVMTKSAENARIRSSSTLGMESALGYRKQGANSSAYGDGQLTTGFSSELSRLIPIEDFIFKTLKLTNDCGRT